ncbi:hypothetical protein IM793_05865 [Pedobacter sp. MR2016-19]|uniref:hypothetical protein n=1 Tax=Pedobacter sp. MR2016-19 TaxID=2780089 RepID=UPI00187589AD|nr:hypothetical protein [Pedobacter sp. MR2016-19]MBE5318671.1 hypothetical protein [Pedobacter sp. MR2016-19]
MDKIYKDHINENEIKSLNKCIKDTKISLKEAKERVRRWLQAISLIPQFKDEPETMPRAIFISINDIDQLKKDYPNTLGIRLYFGLKGEGQATVNDLSGLLVPVFYKGEAIDPIENDTTKKDLFVYDFTTPCPPVCDRTSELHIPFSTSD